MFKEYRILEVKPSGRKDNYGNEWFTLHIEGENSSILGKFKSAPVEGSTIYGEIKDEPKKDGNGTYPRLYKRQREEQTQADWTKAGDALPKIPARVDNSGSIERQVALKAAVEVVINDAKLKSDDVLGLAEQYDAWLKHKTLIDEPAPTDEDFEKVKDIIPGAEEVDEVNLDDIPF